jgi:hypothetical protein
VVTVNTKYPHDMADEEIQTYIRTYSESIVKSQANLNAVLWAAPLIQLGHMELQNRQFRRNAREIRRTTYASLGLAALSLFVATAALWFALDASRTSDRWEDQQLALLESLGDQLKSIQASTGDVAVAITSLESTMQQAAKDAKSRASAPVAPNTALQRTAPP